ncbi:S1 family peptidase [Phreatobacter sp.]|uniref:S1 family peptidase n=1 Tax=Phreatobacter sp. TaxID=1966341 RepID=UPI003F7054DB
MAMRDRRSSFWCLWLPTLAMLAGLALAVPARAQTPPAANPQAFIVNRNASPIVAVFATPVADQNWGYDKLAGTIRQNQRWQFRGEAARGCNWDIFVIFQNDQVEEKRNQNICQVSQLDFGGQGVRARNDRDPSPPTTQSQPPNRSVDTMIVNQGPATVVGLFTQSQGAASWGNDHLGTGTLRPQGRFHLRKLASQGCTWNIRIVFAGGHVDERTGIDLCAMSELLAAGRSAPGQVIAYGTGFYVSRHGHVLTTYHSVRTCTSVAIARQGGQRIPLVKVADDAELDLALFRVPGLLSPVAPFRIAGEGLRAGERLTVVGYPARRVIGQVTVAETTVIASPGATAGTTRFQFQGGAVEEPWGAPIYDQNGLVVGVANDPQFVGRAGTAISHEAIQRFLRAQDVTLVAMPGGEPQRMPSMQDYAFPVVLPLDCVN